jgi:predicted PurR-regulated permease PerM
MSHSVRFRSSRPQAVEIASLCLAGLLLLATLLLHLLPALFSGLITFVLIHALSGVMAGRLSSQRGKLLAVALIAVVVVCGLCAIGFAAVSLLKADAGLSGLFQKMALILDDASAALPASLLEHFPTGSDEIREWFVRWLRGHSTEMQLAGKMLGIGLAHVLVGMVIGAMVAFHEVSAPHRPRPLAKALLIRVVLFVDAFKKVVFAQVRIALINTLLTAIYLAGILPLLGIHLPFLKTMIALTFILGLLPVIGNLLSNAIIIIVSVSYSLQVSLGSLIFLIVIHKMEYLLNARIVGGQIRARVWELLLAMLLMESLFGVAGVVAAPVFYAYLKFELEAHGMI